MSTSKSTGSGKLRAVVLQNIQSHKKTTLELHPNVTVIIGDNRAGKTAFLRAIRCHTDFAPMMIRDTALRDGEEGIIRLLFEDMTTTYRRKEDRKGKLIDQKFVLRIGKEKYEFTQLGRGKLPPDIVEAVNMGMIDLDGFKVSLNMAMQHDSAFLLGPSFTGSTRLKILGTVNDQHLLDIGLRKLNAEKRALTSKVKHLATDLKLNKEILEGILKESDLTIIYDALQGTMETIHDLKVLVGNANAAKKKISARVQMIKNNEAELAALPSDKQIDELAKKLTSVNTAQTNLDKYRDLYRRLNQCHTRTKKTKAVLASLPDTSDLEMKLLEIQKLGGQLRRNQELLKQWKVLNHRKQIRTGILEDTEKDIEIAQLEIDKLVAKGAVCPFYPSVKFQAPCRKALLKDGVAV